MLYERVLARWAWISQLSSGRPRPRCPRGSTRPSGPWAAARDGLPLGRRSAHPGEQPRAFPLDDFAQAVVQQGRLPSDSREAGFLDQPLIEIDSRSHMH